MSKKSKKIVKATLWIAALGALVVGVTLWRAGAGATEKEPVRLVKARQGTLDLQVTATGTVEPEFTVEIKSRASGEVTAVKVVEGQLVKKGDLLLTIDPIVEQRRVSQAEAELHMAQASANAAWRKRSYAMAQRKRERSLLAKGLTPGEAVDALDKEVGVLGADAILGEAKVRKAKEQLAEARDRLQETTIQAPITGTVLQRVVQPGQIVSSATNTVSGGSTLLKIADLSQLFVRVKVDEADVARLKVSQAVRITADGMPGKSFGGKVLRIAPQGTLESNVTLFEVLVAADAAGSAALRPMMSANVEIVVADRAPSVLVPQRAVQGTGSRRFVVLADGAQRVVKVGLSMKGQTEILSGLEAGAQVQLPLPKGATGAPRTDARKQRGMSRVMGGGR